MSNELKVGDKLWYASTRRNRDVNQLEVIVTKVGRKYAEISYGGYRIDLNTFEVDGKGYTSPGRCYKSKEEFDEICLVNKLYDELRQNMGYTTKATSKDIIEAARLLGVTLSVME